MPSASRRTPQPPAAAAWFNIHEVADQIFVIEEPGHVQSYLVNGEHRSALVDTGLGLAPLRPALERLARTEIVVLNTHWHFDHVMGNPAFETIAISREEHRLIQRGIGNATLRHLYIDACLAAGPALPPGFDLQRCRYPGSVAARLLTDGDTIDLGGRSLAVLATPGHTRGSLSFLDGRTGALICGDLVYAGTLYAHFTDSDTAAYRQSLESLLGRGDAIRLILPGHNRYPLAADWIGRAHQLLTAMREDKLPVDITAEWGAPVRRHHGGQIDLLTPLPGTAGVDMSALLWPDTIGEAEEPI